MTQYQLNSFMGLSGLEAVGSEFISQEELLGLAYFKSIRDHVVKKDFSNLTSIDGRHRCLAAGSKVLMSDGSWKEIENIKIEDIVFSPQLDNSVITSLVTGISSHFETEVYDVIEAKSENKRIYTCSGNHKIPCLWYKSHRQKEDLGIDKRKRYRKYQEVTAKYLSTFKNANRSRATTFTSPEINFSKADSLINGYCLGLWLGDGHCSTTKRKTTSVHGLGITTNNLALIDKIKEAYPNEINSIGTKKGTTAVTIRITTKPHGKFFLELKKLFLVGTNSGTKFIPKECLLSSIDYRWNLLAGLMDTDGSTDKNGHLFITLKSYQLIKDISDLVSSLGGYGRITKTIGKIKSIGFEGEYFTYRFSFNYSKLHKLSEKLNNPMKKERLIKYCKIFETTTNNHKTYEPRNISIKCIPTNPQMVYGITLDSQSQLFITNDWFVTHNSSKSVTGVTIGYLLDEDFFKYLPSRIVQDHLEFVDAIEKIAKSGKKGSVIMIDESGLAFSSSDWYERYMKVITQMVQVFGYLCPIILFVAPVKDFVDSRLRKMFHSYYKMDRYNNEYTNLTPYNITYSGVFGKWLYKKPVVKFNGRQVQIKKIRISKPPAFLIEQYRNLEVGRKDKIMERFIDEIQKAEVKEQKNEVDPNKLAQFVAKNYQLYESKRSKPDNIILDENRILFAHRLTGKLGKYIKDESERLLRQQKKIVEELIESKPTGRVVA